MIDKQTTFDHIKKINKYSAIFKEINLRSPHQEENFALSLIFCNTLKIDQKNVNIEELDQFNLAKSLATIKYSQELLPSNAFCKVLLKYNIESLESERSQLSDRSTRPLNQRFADSDFAILNFDGSNKDTQFNKDYKICFGLRRQNFGKI